MAERIACGKAPQCEPCFAKHFGPMKLELLADVVAEIKDRELELEPGTEHIRTIVLELQDKRMMKVVSQQVTRVVLAARMQAFGLCPNINQGEDNGKDI